MTLTKKLRSKLIGIKEKSSKNIYKEESLEKVTPKEIKRTPAHKKAKKIAKDLRKENPDYTYIREIFRYLRRELSIDPPTKPTKIPSVPTAEEIQKYYEVAWKSRNMTHLILMKTLLYTGVRVSEVIGIKIEHVDFDRCQIKIIKRNNKKERLVPFPVSFKELLAMHVDSIKIKKGIYLFESRLGKPYTDRGVRKILAIYTKEAGMEHSISPRKLRHFLFTWMKKQGIEDAFIQSYSGHDARQSLEIYSKLSINEGQEAYNDVINKFPV